MEMTDDVARTILLVGFAMVALIGSYQVAVSKRRKTRSSPGGVANLAKHPPFGFGLHGAKLSEFDVLETNCQICLRVDLTDGYESS